MLGIVKPVGTPDATFHSELRSALQRYEYQMEHVKLSSLLRDRLAARGEQVSDHEEDRIAALMDEGDRLCRERDAPAAVALLGVAEIRAMRARARGDDASSSAASAPVPRTAYVIDSLKRPEEITQLRRIYGDHILVVSLQAPEEARAAELRSMIGGRRPSMLATALEDAARGLIDRDLAESDRFGQNTQRAFPMADVFIEVDTDPASHVRRFVDLLFDSPEAIAPSADEYAMRVAATTALSSPELGRRVGAVLVDTSGRVLGVGYNAHPNPAEVPQRDSSEADIVRLIVDTLSKLSSDALNVDARDRLLSDPDEFARELVKGPLATARIRDLIEFQVPIHAEMNAILNALEAGADVRNANLHVTAYPCHHCAKHVLKLGLALRFLEPYPKSRAAAMYGDAVNTFRPFTGVAPRRYDSLFGSPRDRKDPTGARRSWNDSDRANALPKVDLLVDPLGISLREVVALRASARQSESAA